METPDEVYVMDLRHRSYVLLLDSEFEAVAQGRKFTQIEFVKGKLFYCPEITSTVTQWLPR